MICQASTFAQQSLTTSSEIAFEIPRFMMKIFLAHYEIRTRTGGGHGSSDLKKTNPHVATRIQTLTACLRRTLRTNMKNMINRRNSSVNREISPNDILADTAGRRTLLLTGRRNYGLENCGLRRAPRENGNYQTLKDHKQGQREHMNRDQGIKLKF